MPSYPSSYIPDVALCVATKIHSFLLEMFPYKSVFSMSFFSRVHLLCSALLVHIFSLVLEALGFWDESPLSFSLSLLMNLDAWLQMLVFSLSSLEMYFFSPSRVDSTQRCILVDAGTSSSDVCGNIRSAGNQYS